MSRLKALIFDVDGTLAETEEVHRLAFNAAFAAAGLDWAWDRELYRKLLEVAGGKERMAHYAEAYRLEEVEQVLPLIGGLHRDKTARYAAMVSAGHVPLRPGIRRLIAEARAAGTLVAIATTTSPDNVTALLGVGLGPGAAGWFGSIGAGDIVPAKKPAPDIYLHVLDELGIAPDEAIAFEDSRNGLLAAQGAGLRTVVTPGLYTDGGDFSGAWSVVSDLGEPDVPYRHIGGLGAGDPMVSLARLKRWLAA